MINEINRTSALASLRPGARWSMLGDVITWNDETQQPTEEEIDAEILRLQAEHDAQEYARSRATEYAPLGDQLDMQYWDNVNGTTIWADHVAEIKEKYPKGS